MANTQQGESMLEKFFSAHKTSRRLRGGISGPHMDAFADDLERDGYAPSSAVRYIRAAAHLGYFVQRRGGGQNELLAVAYVHVVFTVPQQLSQLMLQNKKVLYDLLFHASSETLLEVARI